MPETMDVTGWHYAHHMDDALDSMLDETARDLALEKLADLIEGPEAGASWPHKIDNRAVKAWFARYCPNLSLDELTISERRQWLKGFYEAVEEKGRTLLSV